MRVICDNCGASYKIPDEKLSRDVNKATCRKCGNSIYIRRPGTEAASARDSRPPQDAEESTAITSAADLERQARSRASVEPAGIEATVPREALPREEVPREVLKDVGRKRSKANETGIFELPAPDASRSTMGILPVGGANGGFGSPGNSGLGNNGLGASGNSGLGNSGLGNSGLGNSGLGNSGLGANGLGGPGNSNLNASGVFAHGGPVNGAGIPLAPGFNSTENGDVPTTLNKGQGPPPVTSRPFQGSTPSQSPIPAPPSIPRGPSGLGVSPLPTSAGPSLGAPLRKDLEVSPLRPQGHSPLADAPTRQMRTVEEQHDPSGDMTLVLVGLVMSVFGAVLLAVNGVTGNVLLGGGGSFFALFGSMMAVLVILSGSRGKRPASRAGSVVGGAVLATLMAVCTVLMMTVLPEVTAGGVTAKSTLPAVTAPAPVTTTAPVPEKTTADPVVAPETTPPATATATPPPATTPATPPAATTTPPAATPPATTPPAAATPTVASTPPATKTTPPVTTTPPKTTPATTAKTETPTRITPPAATPAPATTAPPAPAPSTAKLPSAASVTSAIDLIIVNNKGVRTCFIKDKKETGAYPSGVVLRVVVQPTGTASSAKVTVPTGRTFDGCVTAAAKGIAYPAFEGSAITRDIPFDVGG